MSDWDPYHSELHHWLRGTSRPSRRALAPCIGEAEMAALRLIGPFEVELDGEWFHYVMSSVPAEADRQRAFIKAWQEMEQAKRPDPIVGILARHDETECAIAQTRARFLRALPRSTDLLDARLPIHFDSDGGVFLMMRGSAWYLTKDGEWQEGAALVAVPTVPSAEERALVRLENEIANTRANVERLESWSRETTTMLQQWRTELAAPKRSWWSRLWKRKP